MSNPLLRPDDPRFRRAELRDEAGQNRFAEEGAATAGKDTRGADPFATAPEGEARPFNPRYVAQQPPRTELLYLLGGLGWTGAAVGVLALLDLVTVGWIAPLLGLGPAAAAWLLAWEDVKAIRVGAITEGARASVRLAMWIGLGACIACAAIVGSMIYREMTFLPDVL